MTTVPGTTDNALTHSYESSAPSSPQETLSMADQPQMASGESEARMKAEEALSRHLNLLQREQSLITPFKTKNTAHEKFPLAVELFKIYTEKFKLAGLSVQEFAAEIKLHPRTQPFEGAHSDLKNDLRSTYLRLVGLANEITKAQDLPYTSPWLQLYELEKETGFSLQGILLLQTEYLESISVVDAFLKKATSFSNFENWLSYWTNKELVAPELAQFYRETFIPNAQKIISLLEKEGDLAALKGVVESYLKFVIAMYPLCPPPAQKIQDPLIMSRWESDLRTESARLQQHPFIQSLPAIAKYASPETVKLALKYSDSNWLAFFYCEKTDPQQALDYLKQAAKIIQGGPWAMRDSVNPVKVSLKTKALQRIAEVKAKIQP